MKKFQLFLMGSGARKSFQAIESFCVFEILSLKAHNAEQSRPLFGDLDKNGRRKER